MADIALKYPKISREDYLQGEIISDTKHEYIQGNVYAMTGASLQHNRISINMVNKLLNHLDGKPCEPFMADVKVEANENFYYPDVIVDCQPDDKNPYVAGQPTLIIEVLSPSTRKADLSQKFNDYQQIASLEEYVAIEQEVMRVDIFRRCDDWAGTRYEKGDEVEFISIGLTLPIADVYKRITFTEDIVNKPIRLARELKKQS